MPLVDLISGKIYGCKKNSKSWWHETGHLVFDKLELGTKVKYYNYFFTMVTVILMPINLFINSIFLKFFTLINGVGVLITYIYEEIWCELYAYKKMHLRNP